MQRAGKRKYHYIYKTTCVITGKYYIGMHSTDDLNDGYVGSGTRLWKSIRKHGKENHVTEIIEHWFSREDLRNREEELINHELLSDHLCLNITPGGSGGMVYKNHIEHAEQYKRYQLKGARASAAKMKLLKENAPDDYMKHISNISNKVSKALTEKWQRDGHNWIDRKHKDTTRRKISETNKERKNHIGEKNSQFGTCWIYNLSLTKCVKIKKENLDEYVSQGWVKGRKKF